MKIPHVDINPAAKLFRGKIPLAAAVLLLGPVAASFADSLWQGGTSDFNNAASWNPSYVPYGDGSTGNADNNSGSNNICLIQPGDPIWSHWDTRAGDAAGTSGAFLQTGSTNNTGGWFRLADGTGSTGYYVLSNGVVNCSLQAHVGETGDGYLEIDGGTFNVGQTPFCMGDGDFGTTPTGILKMTGGTVNLPIGVELWLGEGHSGTTGGTGTMIMSGGTVNIGSWFAIGRFGGIGDLELSGGSITMSPGNGGNITIATTPSTGIINQTGGSITNTATQTWVAESNLGTWNLNGGWDVLGAVHLTQNAGAQGTFNLNGGDLVAAEITDNGGNGSFNFNGGTLHAGATTVNFMHDINGGVFVGTSGAFINTEGHDITISQALSDAGGGLTKSGAGALTLSGMNNYSGQTTVINGTLITTTESYAYGATVVKDGAGFGVTVVAAGEQYYPASLTLGNTTGATLDFDLGALGNPTAAPLNVAGNLAVNGNITVNIADALPQLGTFHLIQYGTLSGTGTFTLGSLPPGVVANLVNNSGYLDLNITSVGFDVWDGLAGGNWDIGLTTNWLNGSSLLPTTYHDGDAVQFDDTAMGSTTVNMAVIVKPGSLTFNNTLLSYTLSGTGAISGAIKFVKQGTNSVTIYNTNSYTGATMLSGGLVVVTNLANGGVASPIGASSAGSSNLVMNGGTLSYAGAPLTIDRGYTVAYNYGANGGAGTNVGTLDLEGDLTLTGPATAAAGVGFVKSGPGTLTYAGSVTNELSGGNNPGYQVMAGTLVFDGSAGHQVNHSQQEFWVGDTTNSGANIILTNTILNVDSWFSLARGNGDSGWVCNGSLYNSALNCGNLSLGWWNNRPNVCSQNFMMTNSSLDDNGAYNIGESAGSVSSFYMGGNSYLYDGGPMLIGLSSGATGSVVFADSSIVTNHNWLSCGANGYGSLTLKDNTLYAEGSDFNFGDYGAAGTTGILTIQDNAQVVMIGTGNGVYVGKTGGAIGIVYQSGNSVINSRSANVWQLGQQSGSSGTWYQNGGTNYAGGYVSIGRGYANGDTSPSGLLIVSHGLFDQVSKGAGLIVGEQGTGTLVVTNTGVVISEANTITSASNVIRGMVIGWNGGMGEVDLGGGTLVASCIHTGTNQPSTSLLNFNGGTLRAGPGAQYTFITDLSQATILSGAIIDSDTNTIAIKQALLDGGMGGGLTKLGVGMLLLDGANTYLGTTTVSAGSLGGTGTIAGPVTVSNGANLAPGDVGIGNLTLSSTLNLAGSSSTTMELNKTSGTSDSVTASAITYGGTLVLRNLSGTLQPGDTFTLFNAGSYTGSFSSVVSQTPGQTVTWDVSQLAVNGTVKVSTVSSASAPLTAAVAAGNISLSWPVGQTGWQLQMQTNSLSVGLNTNWVAVPGSTATNQVNIPIKAAPGATFFRLKY